MSVIDSVIAAVGSEEGWRAFVYDDATGKPLRKGDAIVGHPTIGYGFCVEDGVGEPMPREVADLWRRAIVQGRIDSLTKRWPPFATQPDDVRDALVQMTYQMGVGGVLGFALMLAALERGDRETAAANVVDSDFGRGKTAARARRVADLMRGHTGERGDV